MGVKPTGQRGYDFIASRAARTTWNTNAQLPNTIADGIANTLYARVISIVWCPIPPITVVRIPTNNPAPIPMPVNSTVSKMILKLTMMKRTNQLGRGRELVAAEAMLLGYSELHRKREMSSASSREMFNFGMGKNSGLNGRCPRSR
jgi:hypothetical protein